MDSVTYKISYLSTKTVKENQKIELLLHKLIIIKTEIVENRWINWIDRYTISN